jgi:hypothetical protein
MHISIYLCDEEVDKEEDMLTDLRYYYICVYRKIYIEIKMCVYLLNTFICILVYANAYIYLSK